MTSRKKIVCLGETIVDLVPTNLHGYSRETCFVPRQGGAPANVASLTCALGVEAALAGGVGDDRWGQWLEEELRGCNVDLRWWQRIPGIRTPVAFVMAQDQSEDGFVIYNEGIGPTMTALWPNLAEIVQSASLLVIGSNTLVHQPERSVTFAACLYANHFGIPYIFDANLRLACWPDGREAIDIAQQLIRSAFVTKMNVAEAALITGFDDPDRAAFEILSMGTALVILTLGGDGVLARGAISVDLLAVSAMPVDTTGAGDAITAALVAELQAHELSFTAVHGGLERGIELAARVTERFGATDVATGPPLQRCGSDLATHL